LTKSNNSIVIEDVPAQQIKNSSQKKERKCKTSKNKSDQKFLKKIRTQGDTKIRQDTGIMSLALKN